MISQVAKDRIAASITALVERLSVETRFSRLEAEAVVRDYVLGITSLDSDVASQVLTTQKLTTVKHSYELAQRAISTLVGAAPDALNTIQELAAALNNDAEIVNEIILRLSTVEQDAFDLLTELNNFRGRFNTDFTNHRLLSDFVSELLQQPAGIYVGKATTAQLGIDGAARDGVLTVAVLDIEAGVKMLSYSFEFLLGTATKACSTNILNSNDPTRVKFNGWFVPQEDLKTIYTSLASIFDEATIEVSR
jgi:hypothetical protein